MAQERWAPIEGFPLYEVSDQGRVRNVKTGHIKIPQINQAGIVNVLLVARGEQSRRSVAVMVAEAFLPEPPQTWNATPINMDGDRTNNWVDNLEWRPRWFAIRYHQQFHRGVARGSPPRQSREPRRVHAVGAAVRTTGPIPARHR